MQAGKWAVMYLYVGRIDFSIGFWNCSDVVFCLLHIIIFSKFIDYTICILMELWRHYGFYWVSWRVSLVEQKLLLSFQCTNVKSQFFVGFVILLLLAIPVLFLIYTALYVLIRFTAANYPYRSPNLSWFHILIILVFCTQINYQNLFMSWVSFVNLI